MKVQIINKSNNPLPQYKTEGSVGMDLCAYISEDIQLSTGSTVIIPTGLYIAIPKGYEAQIRSRSGLAAEESIFVLNSPGTIDSDYRGEIKIILHSDKEYDISDAGEYTIHNGDRIAQMVICPIEKVELEEVEELDSTDRGEKGFGSTGISDNAVSDVSTGDEYLTFEEPTQIDYLEEMYSYFDLDETTDK